MKDSFSVSREITAALNYNEPVVALESSVIAQGLPEGANLRAAEAMMNSVRENGAIPAVVGLIEGKVRVGLQQDEIEQLASGEAEKISISNLPYALWKKHSGGTTVSATLRIASSAGISTVATGGIGGVHRDAANTLDISADLWELVKTPVTLVSSGFKSILDIPATMEWLDTHGLSVYGYQTDHLPAFYNNDCDINIPSIASEDDYVSFATLCRSELGYRGTIIIAVPVPNEHAIPTDSYIQQAASEALEQGVAGKALTPFLLNRLAQLSDGKTVQTNIAVLENNCAVAARLAKAALSKSSGRCGFSV